MEYLTFPTGSKAPPIIVPYLPGFRLDGDEFKTFPSRVGFGVKGAIDITRPARELASLAQEWLFFGLIEALADAPVERSLFVSPDGQHIDAKPLEGIITRATRALRSGQKDVRIKEVRARLSIAILTSRRLDQVQIDDEASIAVFLSIRILTDFARGFINTGLMAGDYYSHHSSTRFSDRALRLMVLDNAVTDMQQLTPVARVLAERMSRNGWCDSQIVTVFCRAEHLMVYYLSFLSRDDGPGVNHASCSAFSCTAYNTAASGTNVRHVIDRCRCRLVGVPEDNVARIIDRSEIPLFRIKTLSEDEVSLELEAHPTFSNVEYTAMSHVWIDGMGNPRENALPTWQLQKMAGYLDMHNEPKADSHCSPLFWMDTLCIPVSEEYEPVKRKAISKMALIYTAAAQVLVMDRDLERLSREEHSPEALIAWTASSKWNTRCWTLQEGVLARKCLFQFRDTAITISIGDRMMSDRREGLNKGPWFLIRDVFEGRSSRSERHLMENITTGAAADGPFYGEVPAETITRDLLRRALNEATRSISAQRLPLVRFFYGAVAPDADALLARFNDTWNLLGRRHTTKAKDLPDIIANLTNVSAAHLRPVEDPVDRMKIILNCVERFPAEIMYNDYHRPRAAKDCADRWVPSGPGPEQVIGINRVVPQKDGLLMQTEFRATIGLITTGVIMTVPGTMLLPEFRARIIVDNVVLELTLWCVLPAGDELPRDEKQRSCLMLDIHSTDHEQFRSGTAQVRGARFLLLSLSDADQGPGTLRSRFDCPVRGTARALTADDISAESAKGPPLVAIERMLAPQYDMIVEQSLDEDVQTKFPRRDRDFFSNYGVVSLPSGFDYGARLAPVLVSVALQLIALLVPGVLLRMTILVLSVVATAANLALVARIQLWIVNFEEKATMDMYKATFEDDWTPGKRRTQSLWTKMWVTAISTAQYWLAAACLMLLAALISNWGLAAMLPWP